MTTRMKEVAARNDRHLVTRARIALGATAAVVLMLTGCTAAGGGGDEDVTLSWQIWDAPQQEAAQAMIDAFEADHPGIDVELSLVPWEEYWTKLQTTATSGSAPDVFWMNTPSLPKYASNGVLLPLDGLEGFEPDAFAPAAITSATFDGTLYGVPKDIDALALWYNKALFEAAGVELPTNDWTWDDMVAAAKQLTTGDVYGIAALSNDQESFYNTIPQSGGFVISDDGTTSGYDDPKTIAGLQAWVDLILKDKVSPTLPQMTDTAPTNMFQSGKLAMIYAGSWMIPVYTEDPAFTEQIGVVNMPLIEQRGGVSNSVSNVGFSGTKHPDQVREFLSYLATADAAEIVGSHGVLPARTAAQQVWADAFADKVDTQVFVDTAAVSTPFPRSLDTAAWETMATTEFARAWNGEITVEEAAATVYEKMTEALKAEQG